MALIKCSDCGMKVSTNAKTCPHCGCPVAYSIKRKLQEKKIEQQNIIEEYDILDHKLKLDKESSIFISLINTINSVKNNYLRDAREYYYSLETIDNVVEKFPDGLAYCIDSLLDEAVKALIACKVYTYDKEHFFQKYHKFFELEDIMSPIYEKYFSILEYEEGIEQYYENIRLSRRNAWSGGGFGIQGALKGYFKAQIMNAGNMVIHNIPDSISKDNDLAEIAKAKASLYKDENTLNKVVESLSKLYDNTYRAVIKELINAGKIKSVIIDKERSNSIIQNVINSTYDKPLTKEEYFKLCAKAFYLNPTSYKVIETIFLLDLDYNDELLRYSKKYGFYDNYIANEQKRLRNKYKVQLKEAIYYNNLNIADNKDFKFVYDKYLKLAKSGLDIKNAIDDLTENRLKFPISENDKNEIANCLKSYDSEFNKNYYTKYFKKLNKKVSNTTELTFVSELVSNICYKPIYESIPDSNTNVNDTIDSNEHFSENRKYAEIPRSAEIFFLFSKYDYKKREPEVVLALTDKGLFSFGIADDAGLEDENGGIIYETCINAPFAMTWKTFSKLSIKIIDDYVKIGKFNTGIEEIQVYHLLEEIHDKLESFYCIHKDGILHKDENNVKKAYEEVEQIKKICNSYEDKIDAFKLMLECGFNTKTGLSILKEKELELIEKYSLHHEILLTGSPLRKYIIRFTIAIVLTLIWVYYMGKLRWYWNFICGFFASGLWGNSIVDMIEDVSNYKMQVQESKNFFHKFNEYFIINDDNIFIKDKK